MRARVPAGSLEHFIDRAARHHWALHQKERADYSVFPAHRLRLAAGRLPDDSAMTKP